MINLAKKYLLNSKKLIQVAQMANYMVKMENNQMKYIKRQFDKAQKEVYDKSLNQMPGIFGKIGNLLILLKQMIKIVQN